MNRGINSLIFSVIVVDVLSICHVGMKWEKLKGIIGKWWRTRKWGQWCSMDSQRSRTFFSFSPFFFFFFLSFASMALWILFTTLEMIKKNTDWWWKRIFTILISGTCAASPYRDNTISEPHFFLILFRVSHPLGCSLIANPCARKKERKKGSLINVDLDRELRRPGRDEDFTERLKKKKKKEKENQYSCITMTNSTSCELVILKPNLVKKYGSDRPYRSEVSRIMSLAQIKLNISYAKKLRAARVLAILRRISN